MTTLFYDLLLAFRQFKRAWRQSLLMLTVFTVALATLLVSATLYRSFCLQQPAFDSHGRVGVVVIGAGETTFFDHVTASEYRMLEAQNSLHDGAAGAVLYRSIFVGNDEATERVLGANLSSAVFRLLQARPLLGRLFLPEDDVPGAAPSVIISHSYWRARLSGAPNVIGTTLRVDGRPTVIVGVMPADFRFPNDQQIWLPLGFHSGWKTQATSFLDVVVRLKPGTTVAQANRDLRGWFAGIRGQLEPGRSELRPTLVPFREYNIPVQSRTSAALLLALAIGFVIIGAINIANIIGMQFAERAREVGIMLGIGIPPAGLARQMAFKVALSFSLSVVAAVAVFLAALPGVSAAFRQQGMPYWLDFSLDGRSWGLLAIFVFGTAILALAGPVYLVFSGKLIALARADSRTIGSSRFGSALLCVQIAVVTALGVCASGLISSSYRIASTPLGFEPEHVVTARFGLRADEFPTPEARRRLVTQLLTAVRQAPGTVAAAAISELPGTPVRASTWVAATAAGLDEVTNLRPAHQFVATDSIEAALGLSQRKGEALGADELAGGVPVIILNESLARRTFGNETPIGRSLFVRQGTGGKITMYRVKAVVGDLCAGGPLDPNRDVTIVSAQQTDTSFFYLTIRTTQTPDGALFQNLRQLVTAVDPRVPLYLIRPYADVVQEASQTVRLTTRITTWYAMAAVVIGCVGVYAAAMSRVLRQRKEFGIRLALGGLPWRVWRGVARRYVVMALTGLAIGLPGGAFTCTQLQHLLLGVSVSSASLYVMTAGVIATCLALALLPAAIAIHRIKPLELLRDASA